MLDPGYGGEKCNKQQKDSDKLGESCCHSALQQLPMKNNKNNKRKQKINRKGSVAIKIIFTI